MDARLIGKCIWSEAAKQLTARPSAMRLQNMVLVIAMELCNVVFIYRSDCECFLLCHITRSSGHL